MGGRYKQDRRKGKLTAIVPQQDRELLIPDFNLFREIAAWLATKKGNTKRNYETYLRQFFGWLSRERFDGRLPNEMQPSELIEAIDAPNIIFYMAERQKGPLKYLWTKEREDGTVTVREKTAPRWKGQTAAGFLLRMTAFCRHLTEKGFMDPAIFEAIRNIRKPAEEAIEQATPITEEHLEQMVNGMRQDRANNISPLRCLQEECILLLMWQMALRQDDVLHLLVNDFRKVGGVAGTEPAYWVEWTNKKAGRREPPQRITNVLGEKIEQWLDESGLAGMGQEPLFPPLGKYDNLLEDHKSKHRKYKFQLRLLRLFERWCEKTGLVTAGGQPLYTAHSLKRGSGQHLTWIMYQENRMDYEVLGRHLHHSKEDPNVTRLYVQEVLNEVESEPPETFELPMDRAYAGGGIRLFCRNCGEKTKHDRGEVRCIVEEDGFTAERTEFICQKCQRVKALWRERGPTRGIGTIIQFETPDDF